MFILAGCTLPPPRHPVGPPLPPNWDAAHDIPVVTNLPPATNAPVIPSAPAPETNAPAEMPPPPPPNPLANAEPNDYEEAWVGLDHWAAQQGFPPSDRLSLTPMEMDVTNGFAWGSLKLKAWTALIPLPTFSLHTSNGVLTVQAGTREAYWDEVQLILGFAPELVQGEPILHTLDVDKTIDPLLENTPLPATNHTIVIDPEVSEETRDLPDALFGKGYTLDWAQRIAALLATNGWTVYLTRTNDASLTPAQRAVFADMHRPDLFLSLCFNTAETNESLGGVETCCLTPVNMPSSIPRQEYEETWQNFPNNAWDLDNWRYAFRLHRALIHIPGVTDNGLRRSRSFSMLRERPCPAVRICGGYLSNAHDSALISSPLFRQKLAEAVVSALP